MEYRVAILVGVKFLLGVLHKPLKYQTVLRGSYRKS
jgi:hypothetical protein